MSPYSGDVSPGRPSAERVLDDGTPLCRGKAMIGRTRGNTKLREETLQPSGTRFEVGSENSGQSVVARGIDPDRAPQHHGQCERAGDPVHRAVAQGHRVGHRVGDGRFGVRECEAREHRGAQHARAQVAARELPAERGEHVQDLPGRSHRMNCRDRIGVAVPNALQRMRQRIEPGADRQPSRTTQSQLRIEDSISRMQSVRGK